MPTTDGGAPLAAFAQTTYPLTLSAYECVFLSDHVNNGAMDEGDPERQAVQEPIGRGLLEKLGSIYLELIPAVPDAAISGTSQATICITRREAWLIRDRVTFGDMSWDQKVNIGASLLHRVYTIILASESEGGDALSNHDRTITDEQRAALVALNAEADSASDV